MHAVFPAGVFNRMIFQVFHTTFSPDSKYIIIRMGKKAFVYMAETGEKCGVIKSNNMLYSAKFSPCGKFIAFGNMDNMEVHSFDMQEKTCLTCVQAAGHTRMHKTTFCPEWLDSKCLLGKWNSTIRVWNDTTSGAAAALK